MTMVVKSIQVSENVKPRIISELKKNGYTKRSLTASPSLQDISKPKITGELLWNVKTVEWHLRQVAVRDGSLYVFSPSSGNIELRLPLRHLNLRPTARPRAFSLTEETGLVVASFQTLSDNEYQKWTKIIAAELLRQTPIHDIRFLDILEITRPETERNSLRRGRSEDCLTFARQKWYHDNCNTENDQNTYNIDKDRPNNEHGDRSKKIIRNKYNFRDGEHKRRSRRELSKPIIKEEDQFDKELLQKVPYGLPKGIKDAKKVKIRRTHRTRPRVPLSDSDSWKTPGADIDRYGSLRIGKTNVLNESITWARTQSMENINNIIENCRCSENIKRKPTISDESGISSDDENRHLLTSEILPTKPNQHPVEQFAFVSVREKKKFFESLSTDGKQFKQTPTLKRSNSIGNVKNKHETLPEESATLKRKKRARSLHDLSRAVGPPQKSVPVREMCRMFENKSPDLCSLKSEEEEHDREKAFAKSVSNHLNQRRLLRGERRLVKLKSQIQEVEETIKTIEDDLKGIEETALQKKESLEIFAALQRRLAEENARLERLHEDTVKTIRDNQRAIAKYEKTSAF